MKKIGMTICGVIFMSMTSYAQRIDSTYNQNESTGNNEIGTQDRNLNQSTNSQSRQITPQDTTSPVIQPLPQLQQQLKLQPQLQPQPLQTQAESTHASTTGSKYSNTAKSVESTRTANTSTDAHRSSGK